MKRVFLAASPTLLGIMLFPFSQANEDEGISVIILQFVLLLLFTIITLSWVSRYVKLPFIRGAFIIIAIFTALSGLYIFWRIRDAMISLPFFVMSSWSILRAR